MQNGTCSYVGVFAQAVRSRTPVTRECQNLCKMDVEDHVVEILVVWLSTRPCYSYILAKANAEEYLLWFRFI